MTRLARIVLVTSVLIVPLGGCASIGDALDPTEWFASDFFNTKKKLPGERKPVFPEGVPGVAQGIPQELVKGNQPPPQESGFASIEAQSVGSTPPPKQKTAAKTDAKIDAKTDEYQPAPREKAKPKPKPKPATAERQPPAQDRQSTPSTARRAPEAQPQQQPQQQQPQQQQAGSGAVQWPDPPPLRGGSQSGGGQSGGVQWPDPPPMR
jgi:hypothetical protein